MSDTLKGCSWDQESSLLRGVTMLCCFEHGGWYSPAVTSRFETKQKCSAVPCNTTFTSLGTSKKGFITTGDDTRSLTSSQPMKGSKWVSPERHGAVSLQRDRSLRKTRAMQAGSWRPGHSAVSVPVLAMPAHIYAQPEQEHSTQHAVCCSRSLVTRKQEPLAGFLPHSWRQVCGMLWALRREKDFYLY